MNDIIPEPRVKHDVLGHRISALNTTQFCAKAAELGGPYASRSARLSSAFHHLVSKSDQAADRIAALSDDEERELKSWKIPAPCDPSIGRWLTYEEADKELEVGLTADLTYCDFNDPRAITRGHFDFAWVITLPGGLKVAYVVDIKRSEWTVLDGPESLQVNGYGLAYADKVQADAYCPGIWSATEGRYWWGEIIEVAPFMSEKAVRIGKRIVAAARNLPTVDNQYTLGTHCTTCYGRDRCPAYLLPPEVAESSLAPLCEGLDSLTSEKALVLLNLAKRAERTAKLAMDAVKTAVDRGLKVYDPDANMLYRPVRMPGRESLDRVAAKEDGVDLDKYTKTGNAFNQHRWCKP